MVQLIVPWQIGKYQNRENFMEKSLVQLSTPMKHVMTEITLRTMAVSVVMWNHVQLRNSSVMNMVSRGMNQNLLSRPSSLPVSQNILHPLIQKDLSGSTANRIRSKQQTKTSLHLVPCVSEKVIEKSLAFLDSIQNFDTTTPRIMDLDPLIGEMVAKTVRYEI